jgi:hypothetical protein
MERRWREELVADECDEALISIFDIVLWLRRGLGVGKEEWKW